MEANYYFTKMTYLRFNIEHVVLNKLIYIYLLTYKLII